MSTGLYWATGPGGPVAAVVVVVYNRKFLCTRVMGFLACACVVYVYIQYTYSFGTYFIIIIIIVILYVYIFF